MNQDANPEEAPSQVMPLVDFYRAESYTREDSIAYLMKRILAVVATAAEDEFRANDLTSDLTNAQWAPLLKLYTGEATTVAELARECVLDAGAMTRLLDRIEAKGLCRRVRSSEDRRVVNIELTDAGRAVAKTIPVVLCKVQNAHLTGFTREEWVMLKSLLSRLLGNALTIQAARKPDGS